MKPKGNGLKDFPQINFKCLVLYAAFCPTVYLRDDLRGLVVCTGLRKVQHGPQRLFFYSLLTGLVCNECSRLAPLLWKSSNFKIAHIPVQQVSLWAAFIFMSDFFAETHFHSQFDFFLLIYCAFTTEMDHCVCTCIYSMCVYMSVFVCERFSSKLCKHNTLNSYLQTHKLSWVYFRIKY